MANLLPPDSQRRLLSTECARFLFTFGVVAAALGVLAIAGLAPSYVSLSFEVNQLPAATSSASTAGAISAVAEDRELLSVMQPFTLASTTPSQAILRAIALRPAGISDDSITYLRGAKDGQLEITGGAPSAASIDAYRGALANDPLFTQVNVPVGSLAGTTNGRFIITLTGDF